MWPLFVFVEHIATVLLERGVHFYTESVLHFTRAGNLVLGLALGFSYAVGAMASHPLAHRFGERRVLLAVVVAMLALHVVLCLAVTDGVVIAAVSAIGLAAGLHWPIVESYVAAGLTPRQQLRSVGVFNVTWSSTVPLGLGLVGLILAMGAPWLLFAAAAACNAAALLIALRFPARPSHIEADHPERPGAEQTRRYWKLLISSRYAMLTSYALMFLLAPLLPFVFRDLGLPEGPGAWASSLMDVVRVVCFVAMGWWWSGWHGRAWPVLVGILGLPVGFVMILFGPGLVTVLIGEVIFGLAGGVTYYAALYYAVVVKNASVDAGGIHEMLIGLGFIVGPGVGLIGIALEPVLGGPILAMSVAVGPLLVLGTASAIWPLRSLWRNGSTPQGG